MDRETGALNLINRLYRAAIGEVAWGSFVGELSEAYSGSLVCLCLGAPVAPRSDQLHATGLSEDFGESLWRNWAELLPWKSSHLSDFSHGFRFASQAFPGLRIEDSEFYRQWMAPRNLPPVWPICLSIATNPLYTDAAIVILRGPEAGAGAEFSQPDLEFGDMLLPHLQRGIAMQTELAGIHWNRRALQEVVERLRMGVILLDSQRRLLKSNRSADHTLNSGMGLLLRSQELAAARPADDRKLQDAISRALENAARRRFRREEFIYFGREGELPSLDLSVIPLLSSPGSAAGDAVLAVIVINLEEASIFPAQTVRRLYSLTSAEADLVKLLVEGASIGEAAERRRVARTTARSQLKSIFSKTGTKSQVELVQLVLSGVMTFFDGEEIAYADSHGLRSREAKGERRGKDGR